MKKVLRLILTLFGVIFVCVVGVVIYFNILTLSAKLDKDKLINLERTVTYYDINGNVFSEQVNGKNVCEIEKIPIHTLNAFIAIEDKRFYSHNGVDYKGLIRAIFNNAKSMSFSQGASTISQQLIKNTHLSSEKTFKRKIVEMSLARKLEKQYSKDEILEKYLNTIYFGNNCYGIKSASKYYFNKEVSALSVNESALLAAIIKAPSSLCPYEHYDKCIKRKNLVLNEMYKQGYIEKSKYESLINKDVLLSEQKTNVGYNYLSVARSELNVKLNKAFYGVGNIKVYTSFNQKKQEILENTLLNQTVSNSDKGAVLIDKSGNICAYYSTCGQAKRQLGSTLKPLIAYAPAIENDIVYSVTKIIDEKTDFNGYSPKNYNDKYYGYVSVKESLAKSLNVCAVKLLNSVGVEKALSYVKKTDIQFNENDNSLCLALGATENGATLIDITSAYTIFNNQGNYISPTCINKITDENGNILYSNSKKTTKIFNKDTVAIVNDMLSNCVTNGTAKKLSHVKQNLYAKTGTVGFDNGNTDAYTISYNAEYALGVWIGSKTGYYLDNSITGGALPASISAKMWDNFYKGMPTPSLISLDDVEEVFLDKISYDNAQRIVLADENAPNRYIFKALFKKNNLPNERSSRFSFPVVDDYKISVNNNKIVVRLCVAEYIDYKVYRYDGDKKQLVYDSKNKSKTEFIDDSILPNVTYTYSIVPYFAFNDFVSNGKEIVLEQVKIDGQIFDEWWKDGLE